MGTRLVNVPNVQPDGCRRCPCTLPLADGDPEHCNPVAGCLMTLPVVGEEGFAGGAGVMWDRVY